MVIDPEIANQIDRIFSKIPRSERFGAGFKKAAEMHARTQRVAVVLNWIAACLFVVSTIVSAVATDHDLKTLIHIFQFYVVVRWAFAMHSFLTQKIVLPEGSEGENVEEKKNLVRIK